MSKAAHDRAHPGEFFLILRGDAGHFDGAAAVGTRRRRRRPVGLVDLRRATSGTLPAVLRPGPSAGPLTCPLRPVLGKGCSLPFAGAAGLIELFLEVFAALLPAVSVAGGAVSVAGGAVQVAGGAVQVAGGAVQVAGGAVQIVDQLGVLPLKLLDALVPRILLSPGRPRTVAPAVLAGHAPCIGTCAPTLHTTSRIFSTLPANQRREELGGCQSRSGTLGRDGGADRPRPAARRRIAHVGVAQGAGAELQVAPWLTTPAAGKLLDEARRGRATR